MNNMLFVGMTYIIYLLGNCSMACNLAISVVSSWMPGSHCFLWKQRKEQHEKESSDFSILGKYFKTKETSRLLQYN